MSAAPVFAMPMSVDDYLEYESTQEIRYEYVGGYLHAMVGGTLRHSLIVGNVFASLREAQGTGRNCRVFASDVKVTVSADVYYYPDVVFACNIEDTTATFIDKPCLVVEVLSPGTQLRDQGEKLIAYRQIESVRGYVIIHQDAPRVEYHYRDDAGAWKRADVIGEHASISLPCPEMDLSLADIYASLPER